MPLEGTFAIEFLGPAITSGVKISLHIVYDIGYVAGMVLHLSLNVCGDEGTLTVDLRDHIVLFRYVWNQKDLPA